MNESNVVKLGNRNTVSIKDDTVVINGLMIKDPQLAAHLSKSEDPELEIKGLIEGGLLIASYGQTSANIEKLDLVGDAVQEGFKEVGEQAVKGIKDLLAMHTDPANAESLAHKMVKITSDEFIKIFDPKQPSSPLNTSFARLDQLIMTLEKQAGIKEVTEKTPRKGTAFNAVMSQIVQSVAAGHGDFSEFVDAEPSEKGSKVGDEVVTLNPETTNGSDIRFVFEYKTEGEVSQPAALRELLDAMSNRNAKAGVFVVDKTPKTEKWNRYSFHSGNRMIIVVDRENPDENLILFSYIWARWTAARDVLAEDKEFDYEKMSFLLGKASDDLKLIAEVRKSLTGIHKNHKDAVDRVNKLDEKLTETLGQAIDLVSENSGRASSGKGVA